MFVYVVNELFSYIIVHQTKEITSYFYNIFVPVSSQDLNFPHHSIVSWYFFVQLFKVRGCGLFCWYWCNWWPSLFILFFS